MSRLDHKRSTAANRIRRSRAQVKGSADKPRLVVNIALGSISAQLVDDQTHNTVASAHQKVTSKRTEAAKKVGEQLAAAGKKAGVQQAVLDRRGKQYHGRLKVLVEAVNEKGIKV